MTTMNINGRELEITFDYAQQGHRVTVWEYLEHEYLGGNWEILANWDFVLCLGATHFETLCNIASDLFEEAAEAETLAQLMGIEMRFSDDADCEKCGTWNHYSEMVFLGGFEYLCQDCHFLATEPATVKGVN